MNRKVLVFGIIALLFVACKPKEKKVNKVESKTSSDFVSSNTIEAIVDTFTFIVDSVFISMTDKNNPRSVLNAFRILEYRFDEDKMDKIIESLALNGKFEMYVANDETIYSEEDYQKKFDEYLENNEYTYDLDSYPYADKYSFSLDTIQNVIYNWSIDVSRSGSETSGFPNAEIYRLITSTNTAKLLHLEDKYYDGMVYGVIDIQSFNPYTESTFVNPSDKKIFAVEIKDFFKESTPDSVIRTQYTTDFSITHLEKEGVAECRLSPGYWSRRWSGEECFAEIKKWLKGEVIHFDFVDGKFIRSEPYFDDIEKNK